MPCTSTSLIGLTFVLSYSFSHSLRGLLTYGLTYPIVFNTPPTLLRWLLNYDDIGLCDFNNTCNAMVQDRETFFSEALQKWSQLNCTSEFVSFEREVRTKVDTLAQLVYHKVGTVYMYMNAHTPFHCSCGKV